MEGEYYLVGWEDYFNGAPFRKEYEKWVTANQTGYERGRLDAAEVHLIVGRKLSYDEGKYYL